ncbi:MAG TPA: sulfur transferase domain-containing protein [Candidatus Baltobacteraceae bacterium]|nr:sulfur transferase domain-containing protein [Candidatus Baltobacteraceae bacterium]
MKNEAIIGGITIGGQPSRDELRSGRFAHVVNIRAAGEEGNDSESALAGSDVGYTHVPWTIDSVTGDDIDRIERAVTDANGAVLVH